MEADMFSGALESATHPTSENADKILQDLGLASTPARSDVHENIEQVLLLPPQTLPAQWLPLYQMSD